MTERGRLFLVATPIGNLEDITLRALRILRECDGILAEDTRRTHGLCAHHGIATNVQRLDEHASPERIDEVAAQLAGGARFALVTDAGSPLVSDPGAALVRAAVRRGVRVEPIPGPSAPIAALGLAGFAGPFELVGFLPRSGTERKDALARLSRQPATIVLFESPNRIGQTLGDLGAALGQERPAVVCRELTKLHEEAVRGTLAELAGRFAEGALGEITVVVGPDPSAGQARAIEASELDAAIDRGLSAGESARDLAKALSEDLGLSKKVVYERILTRRGGS
jgi:16S rRNA (cytidine1402-2'-O)-methyltransferase